MLGLIKVVDHRFSVKKVLLINFANFTGKPSGRPSSL